MSFWRNRLLYGMLLYGIIAGCPGEFYLDLNLLAPTNVMLPVQNLQWRSMNNTDLPQSRSPPSRQLWMTITKVISTSASRPIQGEASEAFKSLAVSASCSIDVYDMFSFANLTHISHTSCLQQSFKSPFNVFSRQNCRAGLHSHLTGLDAQSHGTHSSAVLCPEAVHLI